MTKIAKMIPLPDLSQQTLEYLTAVISQVQLIVRTMVRILSTGEIVNDDDPRVQQGNARPRQNMGTIQHDPDEMARQYEGAQGRGGGQQFSVFDGLNQRLVNYGFPRFNIGAHTVEPIVSVGFILAGLLLGLPGLLLAAILFFVSKMSAAGGGLASFLGGDAGQGQGGERSRPPQGGGQRLGRS